MGKDYRAAIDDCTSAVKLNPAGAVACWGRALAYSQIDEDKRAAEDWATFRRPIKIPGEAR